MKLIVSCISTLLISFVLSAQGNQQAYEAKTYKLGDNSLNYRILYPKNFDTNTKYPLLVFLHGRGESGTDNKKQLVHGSKLFQDSIESYPAVVIFPQCPSTDYWANLHRPEKGGASRKFTFNVEDEPNPSLALVISLIDSLREEAFIDQNRLYVGGLSMGGMGVWELLWRMPEKIAAAFPICGGGPPQKAYLMTPPVWAFHGVKDDVVHYGLTLRMVRAMQQSNHKAKVSLYPNANHNSWDDAFAEPKLLSWLFSKSIK